MKGVTTALTMMNAEDDAKMTGKEMYPIVGGELTEKQLSELMFECKGLNMYWDCIRKAYIVKKYKGRGVIVGGKCMVTSKDGSSAYGHYWNPPYELHAWWQEAFDPAMPTMQRDRIDIALPGLIMKGSITKDRIGVMLTGRKPVVLAGFKEDWMYYEGAMVIPDSEVI